MDLSAILTEGLSTLSLQYTDDQVRLLLLHISEIERWNVKFNLVKAKGEELAIKHTLDSLAGLPAIAQPESILDIGSGAGFPGIPLAIFLPHTRIVLAERLAKRAAFLKSMAILLKLPLVRVVSDDYGTIGEKFGVVTCRAFTSLPGEIDGLVSMLAPRGTIAAYKGKRDKVDEEIVELSRLGYPAHAVPLCVPFLDEERHMLFVSSKSSTAGSS